MNSLHQNMINVLHFSELFVSQRNSEFDSRYKFTAKELDNETNYTYFGARYYDSDLSILLSVDPLSDKYPSLSPYAYCANNPVILVDPDGMQIDPTDLRNQDDATYQKIKTDWQNQTGYTLYEDDNGLMQIDYSKGIMKDDNGKEIGSSNARVFLEQAINSEETYFMNYLDEGISYADRNKNVIGINGKGIDEAMRNSVGINPLSVGYGITAFHELGHIVTKLGDCLDHGLNENTSPGMIEAVLINPIRKQLGYDKRMSYGTQIGDYRYIAFDRTSKGQLKRGRAPIDGKYTRIYSPTTNTSSGGMLR